MYNYGTIALCGILQRRRAMHMWCPDVIGREVWEWVGRESESWLAMISPPKGGRSPHRGVSTDWVERVGPGLRLLLLLSLLLLI